MASSPVHVNEAVSFRLLKSMILFVAILLVWTFVAPLLAERLIVARPMEHADAILVLAGSSAYLERTKKAAFLYKEDIAPRILLTNDGKNAGWSQKELKYQAPLRRQGSWGKRLWKNAGNRS